MEPVEALTFAHMPLQVPIINRSGHPLPHYATEGAAGMDLRAVLQEPLILQPLQRAVVPTGIFIALPPGYEAQVRPRSGLAARQGITCLNAPGTIDCDYRGEVQVILINLSAEVQTIKHGDRIAQMVVQQVEQVQWQETLFLDETGRSAGGFGSTGKQ